MAPQETLCERTSIQPSNFFSFGIFNIDPCNQVTRLNSKTCDNRMADANITDLANLKGHHSLTKWQQMLVAGVPLFARVGHFRN